MWIVVELQQRLVETWTEFQRSIVGEAIEQWRTPPVEVPRRTSVTKLTGALYSWAASKFASIKRY